MLTTLLLAFAAQGQASPAPTAAGLISKMFERYASAKSLGGTIRTTQVAESFSRITDTNLAYERPSRMRLEQRQKTPDGLREKMLVSNGDVFQYTPPTRIITATPFLTESVHPANNKPQTVGDLYSVLAADLPDRSPVLDALIGRVEDLSYFKNQLARFHLAGRETVGDRQANVIEGDWRESEATLASGTFRMDVTDDGDLLRYVLTLRIAAPGAESRQGRPVIGADQVTVTTTWDVAMTVNAPIKPETFALRAA